ncbi:MAG: DUF4176 domain-containing protein [Lachnospiraceae bacterium]|nr:DUF4176 domain-containing protein [Lachnospiraceae bacterium]
MKIKELLPIGSIIWLRDAQKPLMIFGIRQTNLDNNVEYDYIGVLYPEGNMGVSSQFMFNHDDIEKVVFRGFEDASREDFIERLCAFYKTRETKEEI